MLFSDNIFPFPQLVFAVLVLSCTLITFSSCSGYPSEKEKSHYREKCNPIIQWLEKENIHTGTYPNHLPNKYQIIIDNLDPPSEYSVGNDKKSYTISIGDYSYQYTFVYYYSPHTGWGMDH